MVIAINTKITDQKNKEENDLFIYEIFTRIISSKPEHSFILIGDEKIKNSFAHFINVTTITTKFINGNVAQWYGWYQIKIPAILKKYKAGIFVNCEAIATFRTNIPQCIIITNLDYIHQPFLFKKSHLLFYRTMVPRSIKKAVSVLTVSQFCKEEIIKKFKINASKIKLVYKGFNEKFCPLDYENREHTKSKYADGNEYFIYGGQIGLHRNLLNLLKAFSAFKKRQKSKMKLFIAGREDYKHKPFHEDLRLFKFKDDVKLFIDPLEEGLISLTASSYAMVSCLPYNYFPAESLQAMNSEVPVIAASSGSMPEILGDAALYADPGNFKEIAVKMMSLFRDENLRKMMIEKGKIQAEKYTWIHTADLVWKEIEKYTTS
ncbi:MAG: glycosyltransferase family 1 protein [Ginsengibacter sp.]